MHAVPGCIISNQREQICSWKLSSHNSTRKSRMPRQLTGSRKHATQADCSAQQHVEAPGAAAVSEGPVQQVQAIGVAVLKTSKTSCWSTTVQQETEVRVAEDSSHTPLDRTPSTQPFWPWDWYIGHSRGKPCTCFSQLARERPVGATSGQPACVNPSMTAQKADNAAKQHCVQQPVQQQPVVRRV
jgi:hypothetical protein